MIETKKITAIIIILSLLIPAVFAGEHYFVILLGGKLWDGTEMKVTVTPTEGVAPLDVTVEETSGVKEIVRWEWDFGDGSEIIKEQAAHHTYDKEGEFVITLTVFNEKEEKASDSTIITVTKPIIESPPELKLIVDPITGDAPLKITATDDINDKSVVEWNFNFGDETSIKQSSNTASHTYEFDGEYTVSLTVTDDKGLTATESVVVTATKKSEPGLNTTYTKVYTGSTPIKNILTSKGSQKEKVSVLKEETNKLMTVEKYPLTLDTKSVEKVLKIERYKCDSGSCRYWIYASRGGQEVAIDNPVIISPPQTDVVVSEVYDDKTDTMTVTLKEDPRAAVQEILQRLADDTPLGNSKIGTKE